MSPGKKRRDGAAIYEDIHVDDPYQAEMSAQKTDDYDPQFASLGRRLLPSLHPLKNEPPATLIAKPDVPHPHRRSKELNTEHSTLPRSIDKSIEGGLSTKNFSRQRTSLVTASSQVNTSHFGKATRQGTILKAPNQQLTASAQ